MEAGGDLKGAGDRTAVIPRWREVIMPHEAISERNLSDMSRISITVSARTGRICSMPDTGKQQFNAEIMLRLLVHIYSVSQN